MVILGLAGLAGSGKSTIGKLLCEEHGFKADSFAAPLKDVVATAFSLPRDLLEGDTPESRSWREQVLDKWTERLGRPITPRCLLQEIGTEVMRGYYEDIWVASTMDRVKSSIGNVVLTDVRFRNEALAIKEAGGLLVLVHRLGIISSSGSHVSETSYNDFIYLTDLEVVNLEGRPQEAVKQILSKMEEVYDTV